MIRFQLPIRIESNANLREHWRRRHARGKAHKETTALLMRVATKGHAFAEPVEVTLTRLGPRKLDGDNLAGGFKNVQDAIAKELGIDDGDDRRVTWRYRQHADGVREYAVIVEIAGADGGP